MKVRTAEAARKLGLSVPAFLDAAADLMAYLHEAWPEVDDGYLETIRQLYGLAAQEPEGEETETSPIRQSGPPAVSQVDRAKLRILDKLERTDRWGGNAVSLDTLRNHYCQGVERFDEALEKLLEDDLVMVGEKGTKRKGPFSLNPARKGEIQKELARVRS